MSNVALAQLLGGIICSMGALLSGFLLGRAYERTQWNELIECGILPRPRKQ